LHADVFRGLDPSDASQVAVSVGLFDVVANVPDIISCCSLRKVPGEQRTAAEQAQQDAAVDAAMTPEVQWELACRWVP
jgi:hypothetical protein